MSVTIIGIEMVTHARIPSEHNEKTWRSHFCGSPDLLERTVLFAWCEGKFRSSMRPGVRHTYVVDVNPKWFYCRVPRPRKREPHTLYPAYLEKQDLPEKPKAERVDVIVRLTKWAPNGAVTQIEIIDIQAWPSKTQGITDKAA